MQKFTFSFVCFLFCVNITFGQVNSTNLNGSGVAWETDVAPATGKSFVIPDDYYGFNAQMLRGPSWQEQAFVSKVSQLKPHIIRYPGGTVCSYWNWRTGWLKEGLPLKFDWAKIPKNPIKLEDIKQACDATGAHPLFVLNMMTSDLEDQFEMLIHAEKIGLAIKYIELDNEVYLGDDFYVNRFATGIDYGKEANIWISKIKNKFPNVKISVVGHSARVGAGKSKKKHFARTQTWNRDVLSVIENADAMTFHVYGGNGLGSFAKGISSDTEDDNEKGNSPAALQKLFDAPESIPVMLSIPFNRWKNTDTYDYPLLPEGMKAWISEYNLFEREGVAAGTWAHGLYALTLTLLYFENPLTGLICYHNLTTSAQFAAIFNNSNGFAKAVRKKPNKSFDFTAAGTCLETFGEFVSEKGVATKLRFSNNEQLSGLRGQHYPALYGWQCISQSKSQKKLLVINLSDKPVFADFSKTGITKATYKQVSSTPHTQIAGRADLIEKNGVGEKVLLIPYSVTIVSGE